MNEANSEPLTRARLTGLRKKWSDPDSRKGRTWEFDGVVKPDHWMSYSYEMREGLGNFDCKTFDDLVLLLDKKLNRKPNVVDLMGGAYFLSNPENTDSLVGIRIHNKDQDFLNVHKNDDSDRSRLLRQIINTPNRRVIEADVLSNAGWKKIRNASMPAADLLVCRPAGPFDDKHSMSNRFDDPRAYAGLYQSLYKRMLSLVNRKGGVIFTEVPDIYTDTEIEKFFERTDKEEGSQTKLFTVPDEDYQWGGKKRRYAVVQFGKSS